MASMFTFWMNSIKCESPIVNLMWSFRMPATRPLGATHLPHDLRLKIFRGEIIVVMSFDVEKLMAIANEAIPRETAE
jgi:hypothetical protein